MAGETTKSSQLTDIQTNGLRVISRNIKGSHFARRDYHAYTTGELELADRLITAIELPSNAIVNEIMVYNDDLDSSCTPALVIDIGLSAGEAFTSVTSGTATKHSEDDVLDADLFVDGSTVLQGATTSFTSQALDADTAGPDDIYKALWQLLGYDEDPRTFFRVSVTVAVAAATAAAGDVVYLVKGTLD